MENDNLKEKKGKENSFLKLAGQIAIIFAVPVFIAALVGTKLDLKYASKPKFILVCLAFAFGLSWAIFIKKYLKIISPPDKGNK